MKNVNKPSPSVYEIAYRQYRSLVNLLCGHTTEKGAAVAIADAVLRSPDEKQILLHAQYHKLLDETKNLWKLIGDIRSVTLDLTGGRHADDPLPDVYAAALSMRMGGDWICDKERSVYRGQRNAEWQVVPTIYRKDAVYETCMQQVQVFVNVIRLVYPNLSDEQCMAAAQHFGAEADTKTALVDVTWDPFVALFFASDKAEENHLGVIDHLVIPEWKKLVASENTEPGSIKVIEVEEILRIHKQRALFLATPDPEMYERYIPYRIWFRQHAGVVFTDEEYEQSISAQHLYPIAPGMQKVLETFRKERDKPVNVAVSIPRTNEVFNPAYLLGRAKKSCSSIPDWEPFNLAILNTCAELYERGKEWSDNPANYSLHRWDECINLIEQAHKENKECSIERAIQFTLSRVPQENARKILVEAAMILKKYLIKINTQLIADSIKKLIENTKGMRSTKGIFFNGNDHQAATVIDELKKYNDLELVDCSNVNNTDIFPLIEKVGHHALIVIATGKTEKMQPALQLLFRMLRDKNEIVIYGDQQLKLHPETEYCLLTWGESFDKNKEAVNLINFWDKVKFISEYQVAQLIFE